MIRWWEALRAPQVATWQQKYRAEWDATVGDLAGGAERAVWETLLEMDRFNYHAGEKDHGAIALVLDLTKASEWVSLPVVWALATHFCFPRKILRVCGYFEHQRRVQFERCVAEPLQTITAILAGYKRSCLLLRIVLQDALSEATKIFPPLKFRVFVDDITTFMHGRNKELVHMAETVVKKLKKRS